MPLRRAVQRGAGSEPPVGSSCLLLLVLHLRPLFRSRRSVAHSRRGVPARCTPLRGGNAATPRAAAEAAALPDSPTSHSSDDRWEGGGVGVLEGVSSHLHFRWSPPRRVVIGAAIDAPLSCSLRLAPASFRFIPRLHLAFAWRLRLRVFPSLRRGAPLRWVVGWCGVWVCSRSGERADLR